jgi:DNA mismatch repair protein MutL
LDKIGIDISSKIKILPDFIANQIAAGEVVQRPESVVKELVENSLDAGADEIAVLIKNAGKQLIHIIDNGAGMNEDDLRLSIKRHATSKIFSQEQLESIVTFGFRGEALASIASVAKLEIRSKQKDDNIGLKLTSEPGKEPSIEPFNTNDGTQIFVQSLFYNTPARRKFLRSNITEFRHISETMIKFAIANKNKRFTFYDDNNIIFDVKPEPLEKRIENLIGPQIKDNLIAVEYEDEKLNIGGFIGTPELAAKRSYGDYLYLNGRPIKSRSLSHAIFTAFEHLLDKNSKPFFILFLSIDPRDVDINVHPQKHEVKFENERYIYNSVLKAVSNALGAHNLFPAED